MISPNFSTGENRLLNVSLSDFAGATKVNSRSAAAQVERQQVASYNAQKPTSTPGVTASQADVQRVLAQSYNTQLADSAERLRAATAAGGGDADKLQEISESQAAYETAQQNVANSARIRAKYSSLDPDTQKFLNEVKNVYLASGAGKPVTLDTATGEVLLRSGGEIEKKAFNRLTAKGLSPTEALEQINDLKSQAQSTFSNTGKGGTFDEKGMFVPPPATSPEAPSADKKTADALRGQIAGLVPENMEKQPGESVEAYYERLKVAIAQRDSKLAELARLGEKNLQAQKTAAATDVTETPSKEGGAPGEETPESVLSGIKTSAEAAKEEALKIADENPLDVSKDLDAAKAAKEAELNLGNEIAKLSEDKAYELQRSKLAVNARAEALADVENTKSQLDQMKLNEENEVKARRKIAKLTGNYDMSGLNFVSKSIQDGLDALNYLRSKAANLKGQFADQAIGIINQYGIDLRQSDIDRKTNANAAYENYRKSLDAIRDDLRADATSRREQKGKAMEKYQETLSKADFQHADNLQQNKLKAMDLSMQVQKMNATQKSNDIANAFKVLALSTKKGVNISPDAMASFEQLVAPNLKPGWMTMVKAGTGDGSYTEEEGMTAIQKWHDADPEHNDITTLTPKKIALLVRFDKAQTPPSGPTPTGKPLPTGIPEAFKVPSAKDSVSGIKKEYDDIVSTLKPGEKFLSFADYVVAKQNYSLRSELKKLALSRESSETVEAVAAEDDVTDSFINEPVVPND